MEKCLHILPRNKMSGAEKVALIICQNIDCYENIVFCGGENLKRTFEDNKIKAYCGEFSKKHIINTLSKLKNIIIDENIKIIHAHDNIASIIAYTIKKVFMLNNIVIISHVHSCYPFLVEKSFNKLIDSIFRRRYDSSILCGDFVYDFYSENTKYFDKCIKYTVSNCIDVENIIKNENNDNINLLRKKFKIPKDKKILGFVGRLCDIKGIVPFIEEVSKVKDKFNDCKFLLVGDGEQYNYIKKMLKELDCNDLFILTGFQENTYDFYPLMDIVFLPSRYEGLPMVLLEAMAFSKPIVSMNVGSISEIVKDGKNGYLVEKNDYKSFVNKLKIIKNDRSLMTNMGKKSLDFVKKNYNLTKYVEDITNIYNSLLK